METCWWAQLRSASRSENVSSSTRDILTKKRVWIYSLNHTKSLEHFGDLGTLSKSLWILTFKSRADDLYDQYVSHRSVVMARGLTGCQLPGARTDPCAPAVQRPAGPRSSGRPGNRDTSNETSGLFETLHGDHDWSDVFFLNDNCVYFMMTIMFDLVFSL